MNAYTRLSIAAASLAVLLPPAAAIAADSYVKDIAPILNRSCVGCHRPGEAAPMSLVGYENVRPWARSIRQRVSTRQMPPWMADAQNSAAFTNDPSLSREEIDPIVRWVDGGAPRGEGAEPSAPALAPGWSDSLGRAPDSVLTLPLDYAVPAASAGTGPASQPDPLRQGAVRRRPLDSSRAGTPRISAASCTTWI